MPALRTLKIREKRLISGNYMEKIVDKGWFEYYGGQGLNYLLSYFFYVINSMQLNSIKVFLKAAIITIIIFIVLINYLYNLTRILH